MMNIYTQREDNQIKSQGIGGSSFRMDRIELLDKTTAETFNTYRNWGGFQILHEPVVDFEHKSGALYKFTGVKALFNNVRAIGSNTQFQLVNNAPLLDTPEIRDQMRARGDCSIKALVRDSKEGNMGRMIYDYSDFMYCKYLGKVSNNYLITLRRFPFPCGDHINLYDPSDDNEKKLQKHFPDVGRLVTWMGTPGNEMSNILKYSVKMPYKELSAEIQDTGSGTAENGGFLGAIMNMGNSSYSEMVANGTAGASVLGLVQKLSSAVSSRGRLGAAAGKMLGAVSGTDYQNPGEWQTHHDRNRIYGRTADTIQHTHIRQSGEDGGLEFSQDISLTFDYEMRSYDGINGKAAFLDLLSNILAVTYTDAVWWGGGFRGAGASQSNAFANLPIFQLANGKNQPITPQKILDAGINTIASIGASMNDGQPVTGLGDIINIVKNLGKNLLSSFLGGALNNLGRPQRQALNSLLSPAPVGLWHLTIGNPKHPIMTMGNMILDGVDIEHYGPLGLDDFPTGLRVNIKLKHARRRDAMQIEQMYMMGDYRIYYPMSGKVLSIYENASRYKQSKPKKVADTSTDPNKNAADKANRVVSSATYDTEVDDSKNTADENKIYMKHFGMTETRYISMGAAEAAWGSNKNGKPMSPDEAKQQLQEEKRKKEQEKKNNG